MRFEDIDLSELPPSLHKKVVNEAEKWERYVPGIMPIVDYPFGLDWWKYVYWIPKLKKQIYEMAMTKTVAELQYFYDHELGVDRKFMHTHYKDFLNRVEWMRKHNTYNHLGEL